MATHQYNTGIIAEIPDGGAVTTWPATETFQVVAGPVSLYEFRFSDDKHAAPLITAAPWSAVSTGSEWMRVHQPRLWSAFCAARLLGRRTVEYHRSMVDPER